MCAWVCVCDVQHGWSSTLSRSSSSSSSRCMRHGRHDLTNFYSFVVKMMMMMSASVMEMMMTIKMNVRDDDGVERVCSCTTMMMMVMMYVRVIACVNEEGEVRSSIIHVHVYAPTHSLLSHNALPTFLFCSSLFSLSWASIPSNYLRQPPSVAPPTNTRHMIHARIRTCNNNNKKKRRMCFEDVGGE